MTETSSRLELTSILSEILKQTPAKVISQVCYMTQGKLHPDFEGVELGMAEKTVSKSLERAYGIGISEIQGIMRKTGDLGDVAEELSAKGTQQALFTEQLTVDRVYDGLDAIARSVGQGSIDARISRFAALLNSASGIEAKFLTRFITGKLRLGVADFTVLDALALAFTENKTNRKKLEKAYNLTSDLGYVAQLLVTKGLKAVEGVHVTIGKPVRPMLAERIESAEAILRRLINGAIAEYKLDGERIQAHKFRDGSVELYSRRLEKITPQYSDVVNSLQKVAAKELIVEGEVVALGSSGKYLPFQELMHRRRKYGLAEAMEKYPVCLNVFDILLIDGRETLEESYQDRRSALEKLLKKSKDIQGIELVPASKVSSVKEIDAMMEESLAKGCEGLMLKDPSSSYRAGAREYAWIKYKPEYITGVRDTVDLVIVGANHGMGRRAGNYGAFLLAAYDDERDLFQTTTKIGTGFSDLDLENLTKTLQKHKLRDRSPRVEARADVEEWFEPFVVLEVLAAEITLSPIYAAGLDKVRKDSGLALRFPKFTGKIREDKSPEDATTVSELLEMYQKQTKHL